NLRSFDDVVARLGRNPVGLQTVPQEFVALVHGLLGCRCGPVSNQYRSPADAGVRRRRANLIAPSAPPCHRGRLRSDHAEGRRRRRRPLRPRRRQQTPGSRVCGYRTARGGAGPGGLPPRQTARRCRRPLGSPN
ncbi:hypothetical protein FPZ46_25040, partial [Mycobacterium helveticum]